MSSLALDLYDRGRYAEVQKRMNALTQKGSTDALLACQRFPLSDTYAPARGQDDCRTYLSVRGSYPDSTDGIKEMIDERLGNCNLIEELMPIFRDTDRKRFTGLYQVLPRGTGQKEIPDPVSPSFRKSNVDFTRSQTHTL